MNDKSNTTKIQTLSVFAASVAMLFAGFVYGWSNFSGFFAEAFTWSRTELSFAFSISITMVAIGSLLCKMFMKDLSLKIKIILCSILYFVGFIGLSSSESLLAVYFFYGIICGLASGVIYNIMVTTINSGKSGSSGVSTGILMMSLGFGGMIIGWGIKIIIGLTSLMLGYRIIAVIFASVFYAISFMVVDERIDAQETNLQQLKSITHHNVEKKVYFSTLFWLAFIWSVIGSIYGLGIMAQSGNFVSEISNNSMMVSLLAGIVSLSNGIGRFSFGKAFDKLGINTCVIIESALFLSATLLLYIALRSGSIVILLISFILIGFAFGAPPTISAAYTHGRFGETNYSFNLSLMMFSGVIGALMGPIIVGKIYDVFGSYYPIIIVLCALSLAQLVIGLVWVKIDDARNTLG